MPEKMKKVCESKTFKKILYTIGILIIAKLIFFAGILVGFHKASFGRAWGEHYNENFGVGHRSGYINNMMNGGGMIDNFPNAHGAIGKIIKTELPNIIVEDKDNIEKVILVSNDTKIKKGVADITTSNLQINDFVVIIGTPNEKGVIEAKLIRVIPNQEFLKQ